MNGDGNTRHRKRTSKIPFIQTEANDQNSIASTSLSFPFWDPFLIWTRQLPRPARRSLYLGPRFPFSVEGLFPFLAVRSCPRPMVMMSVERYIRPGNALQSPHRSPFDLHSNQAHSLNHLQTTPLQQPRCNSSVSSPLSWPLVSNMPISSIPRLVAYHSHYFSCRLLFGQPNPR